MKEKKKLKLKKFYIHPITMFVLFSIILVILSGILSKLQMQATYNTINGNTNNLDPVLVVIESLFSISGFKYLISNAMTNFLSFAPLGTLLVSMIGLAIAEGTGYIETFSKKFLKPMPNWLLTFIVIFVAACSSLINEIGYAILIPMFALIYFINGRNPILGIVTSFCGVAFSYGVSIFVGTMDISLLNYTQVGANLIDPNYHVALSSNLIFIIIATVITSIVGTLVIEKIIAPKIGHYKKEEEFSKTEQYRVINYEEEEQKKIEREKNEKKGLKWSFIIGILLLLCYIYALIPGLPHSGILLDSNANTYVDQLFGDNAYFQASFTYMVAFYFIITGLTYGIAAKTIKSDKDLISESSLKFKDMGSLFILLFVVSQFISIYKKSNIGLIITTWLTNLLESMSLSGITLVIVTLLIVAIASLFLTSPTQKWMILSPVVVPMFMQANISPEFAQVVMRSGLSMTNGVTILLANFALFIGFLNIYNLNKKRPYTIGKTLKLIRPYFLIMSLTWILLVVGWFIIKAPIGVGVFPTL